ncbi:MAG TPA: AI-2E family transporter [Chthoniobacterales bacterium]|nr:AI-2E family transporter [Chthoniobacterales bacterium]
MSAAARFSYIFVIIALVLIGVAHLGVPFVTVLFSFFALRKLSVTKTKSLSVIIFIVLVAVVLYGIGYLVRQAVVAFPTIAEQSIPPLVEYAQKRGYDLPFSDLESLKATTLEVLKDQLGLAGNFGRAANFGRTATRQFVFVIVAVVIAISLFLRSGLRSPPAGQKPSLFTTIAQEIESRVSLFYESFERVMGAQLTISAINTVLTAIFVVIIGLKYVPLVIGLTFLCGLLPIVGNLISNSVIVGIAFTESGKSAIAALVFLVLLHKLEYFLNSKIIGNRIKNPMWITLLALLVGERFMGIPGMILAPVILDYVKVEMSRLPAPKPTA